MKLLNIGLARAMWFFPLTDLNPRGKSVERELLRELAKRYSFSNSPTPLDVAEARRKNEAVTLRDGVFKNAKGQDVEITLHIYRDALFADGRSDTKDSEDFLTDALEWLSNEFGLVDHTTIRIRRLFASEIIVSLDKSMNLINPKFGEFAKMLGETIQTPFQNIRFEMSALGFWIDPDVKHIHVPFRLERQADFGFSQNRYYSIAPLGTEDHLDAIQQLEKMMSG
jgi:hypothetical protein